MMLTDAMCGLARSLAGEIMAVLVFGGGDASNGRVLVLTINLFRLFKCNADSARLTACLRLTRDKRLRLRGKTLVPLSSCHFFA